MEIKPADTPLGVTEAGSAGSALFPVTELANKPNKIQIKTAVLNVRWQGNYTCREFTSGLYHFLSCHGNQLLILNI